MLNQRMISAFPRLWGAYYERIVRGDAILLTSVHSTTVRSLVYFCDVGSGANSNLDVRNE